MASGSKTVAVQAEQATGGACSRENPPLVSQGSGSQPTRGTASKYDFVKVKVWLGTNADHYYILSRFLISRMHLVTKNAQNEVSDSKSRRHQNFSGEYGEPDEVRQP